MKKKSNPWFFTIIILTFFFEGCAFNSYYSKAIKLGSQKNILDEKIKYLTKALEKWKPINGKKKKALALQERGICYSYKGLMDNDIIERKVIFDKAISDFKEALKFFEIDSEKTSMLYYNIGESLLFKKDEKDYNDAEKNLYKAIELNPELYMAYWRLGDYYTLIENFDYAIVNYTRAIEIESTVIVKKLEPEDKDILEILKQLYRRRAEIYEKKGMKEQSKKDYAMAETITDLIWGWLQSKK